MKLNNKYYLLRHGEAKSNVENIVSCWPEKFHNPLTKKGVAKIERVAKELKNKNIDLIFSSPLLRTKQTAEIVAKTFGLKVKFDKRLRELGFGTFNNGSADKFINYFNSIKERIKKRTPGGENYVQVLKRVEGFLKDTDKKNKNKNILIVSHQAPLLLLLGKVIGEPIEKSMDGIVNAKGEKRITKGELIELN